MDSYEFLPKVCSPFPIRENPFAGTSAERLEYFLEEEAENKALREFAKSYEMRGLFAARLNHLFEAIQDDHLTETGRLKYWEMLFGFLDIYKLEEILWVVPNAHFLDRCEPKIRLKIENGEKLSWDDRCRLLEKMVTKKKKNNAR